MAQSHTLAVLEFSEKMTIEKDIKSQLESSFIIAANNQLRFTTLEREQLQAIQEERERQKSGAFVGREIAAQGKAIGADFLIVGEILEWSTSDAKYPASGNYPASRVLRAKLDFNVNILSTETAEIIHTSQYTFYENKQYGTSSAEYKQPWGELKKLLYKGLTERFQKYAGAVLYQAVPPTIKLLELSNASGKKVKEVLIGTTSSFDKNTILEMYKEEWMQVEGEKIARKIPVGVLRVFSMDGEKIATCKVLEGSKEIKSAFEMGESLLCTVKDKGIY